jgi:uncharacterized membrane protein
MMRSFVVAYFACALVFLGLDALWIGLIAKSFYVGALGSLMRDRPLLVAALAFYLIYAVGIVVFAVEPALSQGVAGAALLGALYGFCAYATYDLTNLATLRGFPLKLAFVDIAWGACVTAVAALVGFHAVRWTLG